MKKKKITFSEPNCRFGCPHFKSVGSVLNETCYCMKKGKKGRRLGKKDLKRRPPEWCPRRLKTPVCRIYGFKDEMHEALELDNRLNFEPDKHDWYFPSSHHYQLQSEFPLGMTAEQFYNALQEEPVESVLNGTPLLFGTVPYLGRQTENALAEVPAGMIEAAESIGSSPWEIIWRVYLREAVPGIARGVTITLISLVNFTAVAGTIGAGGLGNFAIMYGHGKNLPDVTVVVILIIIVLVSLIQAVGSYVAKKTTH